MSYILEALKKADAERKLGHVPNIHAQPVSDALPENKLSAWSKPWRWVAAAAFAAGALGLAWFKPWQTVSPPAEQPAPKPVQARLAPPTPIATPAPAEHPPETASVPPPAEPKPAKPKGGKTLREPHASRPASATTKDSPAPEQSLPTFHDLPESIQREIPHFAVGGYLYSDRPADRSVLIDKRLLRDGDQIAPGLKLEKMMPNGMVLDYKGYRYRTSY